MANLFPALKGRRVLLTGHTGFKGSWLTLWLHRLGAQVTGYALPAPTDPSNYASSNIRELLAGEYLHDIRDTATLQKAFAESKPDVVLHLAAQPIVRESYVTPHETFDVNVTGTSSVLDAVRRAGRPMVAIVVTSDKCYDNKEQIWGYRECDELGGFDPYSASKGAAEIVTASYRNAFFHPKKLSQHGVKIASARAGNVIGGGDWAKDRIMTDMVAAISTGKPIPVRNPRAIRPWQHVLEPLSGYLTLADRLLASEDPAFCSAWNFGPASGTEENVATVVAAFIKHWGSGSWDDKSDPNAHHEAGILRLSIEKAITALHWHPQWNFEETIARTAHWYRAFSPSTAMRPACLEDIQAYERAMQGKANANAKSGAPTL